MTGAVDRDELRTLFLFEALTDEQLDWLAERGDRRVYDGGTSVHREGEPSAELFVLMDGALRMSRLVRGEDVVITETDHRGAYSGAVRAYVEPDAPYSNSVVTTRPSSFFVLPGREFATFMRTWFPMSVHLLEGLFLGVRNTEATVRQREHLAQLGTLSANLAHELNNPASAAVRATEQLRDRVAGMRHKLGMIADGTVSPDTIARLTAAQEAAVDLAAKSRHEHRTPMQETDLEDALVDRLDALGVGSAYELASVYVTAGLDAGWLDRVVAEAGEDHVDGALRWLAYTLETESLMDEIQDATGRISALVASVKQYAYLGGSSVQEVDVHLGLDSTVVMLGHKLQGVQVVREYDRTLPKVPAHPAELNQVWTNLIDNAAEAMGGHGRLLLRTGRKDENLTVEICDDGPGMPEAVQPHVFTAFFTTKAPGEGSGLGLDSARRIVEGRHRGRLSFTTGADGTTFEVQLPFVQMLASPSVVSSSQPVGTHD
jgi:signal transduction histidine kinase